MKPKQPLDLALIGNGRMGALINRESRIVWCCFPRFDGDPVFSRLLSGKEEKGFTDIVMADVIDIQSAYARNTPVLETVMTDRRGGAVRITDFMPRFQKFERTFRPPQMIRRIEPIAGRPRIAIRVRPTFDYGSPATTTVIGSNHIRYVGTSEVLRLSTDAPLSYITHETTFALMRPVTLIFGTDEPFVTEIDSTALDFENRTRHYWLGWVRSLAIPFEWQDETIRAAITLKLCSFDETGAIIAAHTTSIPEAPNTSRNWDYRFCWLRDAYYVVNALNRLGATQTMENFLNYLTTVVTDDTVALQPLHAIIPGQPLEERHAEYPRRLPRPRPRAHRQRRLRAGAARRIWQRHPRHETSVRRPAPAADGRRRPLPDARAAGRTGLRAGAETGRGHLGIPGPRAGAHLFGRPVLGGLRPARADRRTSSASTTAAPTGASARRS